MIEEKTLILGLGTGCCGTLWLHGFLKQQEEMGVVTSEAVKFGWYYDNEIKKTDVPLNKWFESKANFVGDIGFCNLPHIKKLSSFFKKTKLIILKRNKEKTIKSLSSLFALNHNCFVPNTKKIWESTGWDKMFPKFPDLEEFPREVAFSSYYDHYYNICKYLSDLYENIWIETEKLSLESTKIEILNFCGFSKNKWNLNAEGKKNSHTIENQFDYINSWDCNL
jgi:hypothetical protein